MIDENEAFNLSGSTLASALISFLQGDIHQLLSFNNIDNIANFILYHGLTTHTYLILKQNGVNNVLTNRLKNNYFTISIRNSQLFETYRVITELFELNQIEFIPLKGCFMLPMIYIDTAGRNISDLDILIHPKDYPKVQKLLLSRGATQESEGETEFLRDLGHHYTPFTLFNTSIEIHSRLLPKNMKYQIPIDAVWQNKELYQLNEKTVNGINHNQLLAYLALHIHYSEMRGEYRLYWYLDVYRLLLREEMQLSAEFVMFIKSEKIEKPVLKIITRVAYLFNLNMSNLKPLSVNESTLFIHKLGGNNKRSNKGYSIVFERFQYTKGVVDKFYYLKDTIMNPKSRDIGNGMVFRITRLIINSFNYLLRR